MGLAVTYFRRFKRSMEEISTPHEVHMPTGEVSYMGNDIDVSSQPQHMVPLPVELSDALFRTLLLLCFRAAPTNYGSP